MKVWLDREVLNNEDLNDNFAFLNRLITENEADGEVTGGFSGSVEEMQETISPGEVGSESLAASLKGEILRLRYQVNEIIGKNFWYERPPISLNALAASFGLQGSASGAISGSMRPNGFPLFLRHGASGLDVTLDTTVPFVCIIKGQRFEQTTDLTLTMLPPPNTQNTALLDGSITNYYGERKVYGAPPFPLVLDNYGTNVLSKADSSLCLNIGSEPIFGYIVKGADPVMFVTDAKRGWFFDSSGNPIKPSSHADNATATLLSMAWVFYRNDGSSAPSIFACYREPTFSVAQPDSPQFGDMWFNTATQVWMRFDGAVFIDFDSVMIGYSCCNGTNVLGTRSIEFFSAFSNDINFSLSPGTSGAFVVAGRGSSVSVYGNSVSYGYLGQKIYPSNVDPDSGTIGPNGQYYIYVDVSGNILFSDVVPNYRPDMKGMYHPFRKSRCVGTSVLSSGAVVEASTIMPNQQFRQKTSGQSTTSTSDVLITDAAPVIWINEPTKVGFNFAKYSSNRPFVSSTCAIASASGSIFYATLTEIINQNDYPLPERLIGSFINSATNRTLYLPLSTLDQENIDLEPGLYRLNVFMKSEIADVTTAISSCYTSIYDNDVEGY